MVLPAAVLPMTSQTPQLRLYSGPLSMFGAKVEIALREKGLAFELVMVPFASRYEPRHPEVVRINPKRQVPVLVHEDLEIFDSTQIFEYLEDMQPIPRMWPQDPRARARARLFELKSDEVYFPHIIRLMGLQDELDGSDARTAVAAAGAFCRQMEESINDDYLCGAFTFADIAFYMAQFFGERLGAPLDDSTPKLLAWRARMTGRPSVRAVVASMVDYIKQTGRYVPPAFRALASVRSRAPDTDAS
jgi:glutathione S-transferase